MDESLTTEDVSVNEYLVTNLLNQRRPHERDHESESREYQTFIRQTADDTVPLLPALAQMAVRLCDARSAAFCLLESAVEKGEPQFFCGAATGDNPSKSGDFLGNHFNFAWQHVDHESPQLYRLPPGQFEKCENLTSAPIELLVIPLRIENQFVGLIWVAKEQTDRHFDSTDLRVMNEWSICAENTLRSIDRKRANFQFYRTIQEAETRKDVYLTGLAHELRHPLAPLRNAVEVLHAYTPPIRECDRAKTVIEMQLGQLTHLIDDLLEISRLFLNKLELRKERASLSNLLYRSIEAALTHEIRHPLTPLQNAVQILRYNCPPLWECNWANGVIDRQLKQLNQLIDDLLDISRIFLNELELRKERVLLSSIVNSAIEASRPSIELHQHELIVLRGDDPLQLEADPSRLGQIFFSLLTNAANYTNPGGRVWLTTGRDGAHAVVTIKDTGMGIAAAMFSRKFAYYTQMGTSPRHAEGGLSIGLALVRQLVELHGGTVQAQTDGIGQGSEFIVRLPLEVTMG